MAPQKKGEANDLATLSDLSEDIILEELQVRYANDQIYTYVGDILIAVNPFKPLTIYHQSIAERYKMTTRSCQAPHIFAVADSAYQAMLGVGGAMPNNQCCVISGESGAGKTESAKFFISHIIGLSRGTSLLQQQILQVNPLLEALGNAQTLMNNNSSRFGKYIQLKFLDGSVVGAKMSEYLLEKSRVVRQNKGEENFHIFYYMFAGLPAVERDKYGLTRPESYAYLKDGGTSLKKVQHNQMRFNELLNAMDVVGFDDEEQENMFTVLGAVLNMGNIVFDEGEDEGAVVQAKISALRITADLLGVDATKMAEVLTSTTTVTRGSRIKKRLKQHQANDVRDATAKSLYGRLFAWIVNKVNQLLAPPVTLRSAQTSEIGILDIFGFEHFEHNSFEQACINLANEKLQYFFNQHIFLWEQEEYRKEGIDWSSITFSDNKPVLDLFLAKPIGLLALLDEESHFPRSSDHSFVEKLVQNCGSNKYFVKSRHAQTNLFGISHYAGKVEYDSTGFLEKNRDTLPAGVMDLLRKSDNVLVSKIFTGTITRTGTLALQGRVSKGNVVRRSRKLSNSRQNAPSKKPTLGSQFRTSLTMLMERMTVANPHFIRCIKPNTEKLAERFDVDYVNEQLRYTGVLETTRIRREGYSVRLPFNDFVDRYRLVAYDPSLAPTDSSCRLILQKSGLNDWHIGKTKVFMKYWHTEKLTELLEKVQISMVKMQKLARGFLARRLCRKLREAAHVQSKKRSTFLAFANQSVIPMFGKQDEMLNMDNERKKDILRNATMSYVGLDFPENEDDFPAPPEEALSLPPKSGRQSLNSLDEIEFEDDVFDDYDEIVEDVFVSKAGREERQFGAAGSKEAAVQWFKQTQAPNGVVQEASGMLFEWFHGIITRRDSEQLLSSKEVGCFLIRVSESRFGYTLSFRVQNRCKHYMIDQTRSGKFVIVGFPRVYKTLQQLTEVHQQEPVNTEGDLLTIPCGQKSDQDADYVELIDIYSNKIYARASNPPPTTPTKRSNVSLPPPLPPRPCSTGTRR